MGLAGHPRDDVAGISAPTRSHAREVYVGGHQVRFVVAGDRLQSRLEVVRSLAVSHRPVWMPTRAAFRGPLDAELPTVRHPRWHRLWL